MCGVVGIVGAQPVNQALYNALTVMQHRGQDAAGIMTWSEEDGLKARKSNGLVRDVFRHRHMMRLRGHVGVAHVRYPTAGGSRSSEAQPFYVNSPYGVCLAHNGNLTNHDELTELLTQKDRRHLGTNSDSEVLLNVLAHELQRRVNGRPTPANIFDAVGESRELLYLFCGPLALAAFFNGAIAVSGASFENLGHPVYSTWISWGRQTLGTLPFVMVGSQIMGAPGVLIGQALGGAVFSVIGIWLSMRVIASPARRRSQRRFHRRHLQYHIFCHHGRG